MAMKVDTDTTGHDEKLSMAARTYIGRRDGYESPAGDFQSGPKWFPSEAERCWCCDFIREPSWRWPDSLDKHCRTYDHVARLLKVDKAALRREVSRLDQMEAAK